MEINNLISALQEKKELKSALPIRLDLIAELTEQKKAAKVSLGGFTSKILAFMIDEINLHIEKKK